MELFAVEIRTRQWQAMLLWYSAVLGLKTSIRSEEDGYALLLGHGWRLALLQLADDDYRDPSTISLALEVADMEAAHQTISPVLTEPVAPPQLSDEQFVQWTLADPDGNRVKLFQFLPPS